MVTLIYYSLKSLVTYKHYFPASVEFPVHLFIDYDFILGDYWEGVGILKNLVVRFTGKPLNILFIFI